MSKNTYTSKAKAKTYVDKAQNRRIRKIESVIKTRELKFQDVAQINVAPNWGGTVFNLIAPSQGDTDLSRNGDKIAIESIRLKFNAGMTGTGTNQLRVLIVRDKTNSIVTTPSNVLDATVLSTGNAAHGPFQKDTRQNFEVYYDKTFLIDSTTNYQIQGGLQKKFKKPKGMQFTANSSTVASGQFKMILVSDLSTPNFALNYHSRIEFSDM